MSWAAHISALVGIVLICASYFFKTHKALTSSISLGLVAWSVHFMLLGALTPAALALLSSFRVAVGIFVFRLSAPLKRLSTGLVLLMTFFVAYLTWQGWTSVPVTIGVVLATIGGYHFEGQALRAWLLAAEAFFLYNAFLVGSELAMVGSLASMTFVCVAFWKHWLDGREQGACVCPEGQKMAR